MSIFNLENKTAIVTGGYGHLGIAMCRALASFGANVIVAAKSADKFNAAFTDEEKKRIKFVPIDITNDTSIKNCFEAVNKTYGSIDILINNAFVLKSARPENVSREDWNYSMDGLITGLHCCIREVLPFMEEKNGKIINISSMYGIVSPDFSIYDKFPEFFNSAQYGASKAAIIQLTKYYANYLAERGVRVNCVSPGTFPSKTVQEKKEFISKLENKVPLKRIGQPEDLSGTIVLLASDASSYITGQNISVDGGWTIS
ncbi:MAG: SDR family oxidoreductase [Sphingobacteriaceae bacterium]|nr:SDR family oxidoreductase [Sphingobacteriaceae bacterium]